MSRLSVFPADPQWQPTDKVGQATAAVVDQLADPYPGFAGTEAIWHPGIAFVYPGEGFEDTGINCHLCGTDLDIGWLWQTLERLSPTGIFATINVVTPCCSQPTTLNRLRYERPPGYCRFEIRVHEPRRGGELDGLLAPDQIELVESTIGQPVRQVRYHG